MDTITHGLAGYVVAKTGLTRDTGRWGVVAAVTASIFPDADNLLGVLYGTGTEAGPAPISAVGAAVS